MTKKLKNIKDKTTLEKYERVLQLSVCVSLIITTILVFTISISLTSFIILNLFVLTLCVLSYYIYSKITKMNSQIIIIRYILLATMLFLILIIILVPKVNNTIQQILGGIIILLIVLMNIVRNVHNSPSVDKDIRKPLNQQLKTPEMKTLQPTFIKTDAISILLNKKEINPENNLCIFSISKLTNNNTVIRLSNQSFSKKNDIEIRHFVECINIIQSAINHNVSSIKIGYTFEDIGDQNVKMPLTNNNKFKIQYIQELNELSKKITIHFVKLSIDHNHILSSTDPDFLKLLDNINN